jgi:ATP-dependent exoDNAse (exonuclease V) alpha subunit
MRDILLVLSMEAQIMMSKELVYTAFTRAEKRLDIIGHDQMLRIAPQKSIVRKRYTNMRTIIKGLKTGEKLLKVL